MKKMILILAFLLGFSNLTFGQTIPSSGDIVFTQVGADAPDVVEFITLVDGLDLRTLQITDNGILADNTLRSGEGTYSLASLTGVWTNVPGGTFVRIGAGVLTDDNDASDRLIATTISTSSGSFNLAGAGDQVIAYLGLSSSPTFIAGINFANSGWQTGDSPNYSKAPGTSSDIELSTLDNYYFNGTVNGDKNTTQTSVTNSANWTGSNTLIGYQDLTASIGNSSLPVELTSFTAKPFDGGVLLNWTTATEVNNYGFDVESKRASTDEWAKIGFVEGHGNSNSPKDYSFIDNVARGNTSFRLKQIDTDGTYEYSDIVTVSGNLSKTELYQNHPNPFNPTTQISFALANAGHVKVSVYNMLGQKVDELVNQNMNSGIHNVQFNADNISSGFYIYRLETPNFSKTLKMLLLK